LKCLGSQFDLLDLPGIPSWSAENNLGETPEELAGLCMASQKDGRDGVNGPAVAGKERYVQVLLSYASRNIELFFSFEINTLQ